MKKRREFVVGFMALGQRTVYGKGWKREQDGYEFNKWTDKMTAYQALRRLNGLRGDPKTIYRLVPVTVAKVKAQAAREARAKKGEQR